MEQRLLAYRIYITDILRASGQWQTPPRRFAELIGLIEQDNRSGDEIAEDVIRRAGLVVENELI